MFYRYPSNICELDLIGSNHRFRFQLVDVKILNARVSTQSEFILRWFVSDWSELKLIRPRLFVFDLNTSDEMSL